jgi:hypothetical protein
MTNTSVLRTFRSRPHVVVSNNGIVASYGNRAHAHAQAARLDNDDQPRVVSLDRIQDFDEAAASNRDLDAAYVSGLALGLTVAQIAEHYRPRMDIATVRDARHIVAQSIRETLGSLSRAAARRQVAAWILDGAG